MKKIMFIAIVILITASCQERGRRTGNACISPDKASVELLESINVSNCGDELPTNYINLSLDWGDGTVTNGQVGSHSYSTTGSYTVKLMFNGEFSADVSDGVDASKVQHVITVQ